MHPLLERQLKRLGISFDTPPLADQWRDLISSIDRHYTDLDQDRYLMDRSLKLSSQEMQNVNEKLRKSEIRYSLSVNGANDGLWDWDLEKQDFFFSNRWFQIFGVNAQNIVNPSRDTWFSRVHPDDLKFVESQLNAHLNGETNHFKCEHRILHTDGIYRWVLVRGLAVQNEMGVVNRIAGSLSDITSRKLSEEKLEFEASHDPLTKLPNRSLISWKIQESLEELKNNRAGAFSVMFIDIDRFKTINDSLGHKIGDQILLRIAEALKDVTRRSDEIARLGGDEFLIIFDGINSPEQIGIVAERVLQRLRQPISVAGRTIFTGASVGIAFAHCDYDDADELIADADLAMYKAKQGGRGRIEYFNSLMRENATNLLQLEIDMRRALEQKEFILHYQPIVSMNEGSIIGFEALARWNHPVRGIIAPNEFIPLAEETGLIIQLGNTVLRSACMQMREWQERYPLSNLLTISVNLSAKQLEQPDLALQIEEILHESRLEPRFLRLEITESVIMHNADLAIETVERLRLIGIRVSIDDFGTGYSSLGYLHRFPVDTLKVDRSFINRIGVEGERAEIVDTIVNLASNLDLEVVAEGVETEEQNEYLKQINCKYGQGFLYSRPMDKNATAEVLRELARKEFTFSREVPSILGKTGDLPM
ncbi:MAG: putative bifunctional diguanylate cyclase/phosphodiesterase [Pyrinomonadaceae bacterium]